MRPAVLGDLRIHKLAAMRLQAIERSFLVRPHQPRVPRHIGGEDRGETALDGLLQMAPPVMHIIAERKTLIMQNEEWCAAAVAVIPPESRHGAGRRTASALRRRRTEDWRTTGTPHAIVPAN